MKAQGQNRPDVTQRTAIQKGGDSKTNAKIDCRDSRKTFLWTVPSDIDALKKGQAEIPTHRRIK
jgi:hypothetical protein